MSSSPAIEKSPSKTSELGPKRDSSELKEPYLAPEHEEHERGVEWVCWTMRCTECGSGYKLIRHPVAGKYC